MDPKKVIDFQCIQPVRMKEITFMLLTYQSGAGIPSEDFKHRSDVICFMFSEDHSVHYISLEISKKKKGGWAKVSLRYLRFPHKHHLNCNLTLIK